MTARTLTLWIFLAAVLVPLIATLVIGLLDRSYARAPKHTPPRKPTSTPGQPTVRGVDPLHLASPMSEHFDRETPRKDQMS